MNSAWQLGWRTLWRDLRAGELRLLVVAVTLAVAALTAVGFFADRLKTGLTRDARQLLGGDAVVVSDNPALSAFAAKAKELGLQVTTTATFPTMARAREAQGGAARLVALKAVPEGYPLRGRVSTATQPDAQGTPTKDVPAPGEAWVDGSLLEALSLTPGDQVLLGDSALRVARVITLEPDRGAGFMSFAPRVMINERDLPASHLVQPASRITYRLAVAGPGPRVAEFASWAEAQAK